MRQLFTALSVLALVMACGGEEPARKPARSAVSVPPPAAEKPEESSEPPPAASALPERKKIPECRSDPDKEVARREFQIALEAFQNANYQLAAEGFTNSYVRSCSPSVLYNLGIAYEQMGDAAGALQAYELYLSKQTDSAHVDEVKKLVERIRQKPSR